MPITDKQRIQRRKSLGSSDLAAVVGVDPYKTAHDVYLSKVYGSTDIKSEAMDHGTFLEDGIIAYAEQSVGTMTRNQKRRVSGSPIVCNIDAIVNNTGNPVEVKTAGLLSQFAPTDQWGEAGSSEVPHHVNIQCHGHMLALTEDVGSMAEHPDHCHVPAFIGGRGIVLFVVPFDREIAQLIIDKAEAFWMDHVMCEVPPTDTSASMSALKRIVRVPNKIVAGNQDVDDWWTERLQVKSEEKEFKEAAESLQAKVIAFMGDAEAIEMPDGTWVTYFEAMRTTVDSKALKAAHPDIYEQFSNTKPSRTMRIKSVKAVQKMKMLLTQEQSV